MVFFWGVDQIEAIKSNSFRRSRTQSGSGAPARASGSKITFDVELGSVIAYRELAREIERERERATKGEDGETEGARRELALDPCYVFPF